MEGRGGQRRRSRERESCYFRYRINLFTGAGLSGGGGGGASGRRWGGVDRENGNSGLIENICAVQNGCNRGA